MVDRSKKLPARFYQAGNGREPVREWLLDLAIEDRKALGAAIAKVEFGWPIGMPSCRPMAGGLFEVRCDLEGGRTARVLFGIAEGAMILLHGFVKKTRTTPPDDLATARRRLKELS